MTGMMVGLAHNPNGPDPDDWDEEGFQQRLLEWLDGLSLEEFATVLRDNMDAQLQNAMISAVREHYIAAGFPL